MVIMSWVISILSYIWDLIKIWVSTLFFMPFKNPQMLWILVPIWLSWFFSEFFQEKAGTSMGNAMTNAVVVLWGGIDWVRQTLHFISSHALKGFLNISGRFLLVGLIFGYGVLIVVLGMKGNTIIKKIGRVREVTYLFVMFTPIFYNVIPFSIKHLLATIIFFPIFYFVIELIDQKIPHSKAVLEDLKSRGGNQSF